jgi:hypothetical protein
MEAFLETLDDIANPKANNIVSPSGTCRTTLPSRFCRCFLALTYGFWRPNWMLSQ